jgi:tetratricopeptide (TPR) repeat protein
LTNEAVASFQNAIYYEGRRADRQASDEGVLARSHVSLGNIFADLARPEEAIASYRAALQADPRSESAAVNLGLTLATLKKFDDAQASFELALRINPASITAHHNLGMLMRQRGREEEARRHFQEASRLLAGK